MATLRQASRFLSAAIAVGLSAAACGHEPDTKAVVIEDAQIADGSCPDDGAAQLISRVRIDADEISVWQTDEGIDVGFHDWNAFADVTERCLRDLAPWIDDSIATYSRQLRCEAWLHNLAMYALNSDGSIRSAVDSVDAVRTLLGHGRPIDMDVRVWSGDVKGHPWDGVLSVCRAVRSVLPGKWPNN